MKTQDLAAIPCIEEKRVPETRVSPWPSPSLRHLQRLTDGCGIIQHAKFWCPEYATGYCTDDNSRALIAVTRYNRRGDDADAQELMVRYLAFLRFAQHPNGHMRNFAGYSRSFPDERGSQDCLGQTIWGLGEAANCAVGHIARPAAEMLRQVLSHVTTDFAPHSLAYTLLGLCAYGRQDPAARDFARRAARPLATALKEYYQRERGDGWEWFLSILTYACARLPQAMLGSARLLEDETLHVIGLRTLDFLRGETMRDGVFSPVGCHGWHPRGKSRAEFDQQPIDAGAMVEACLTAHRLTHQSAYEEDAIHAMGWFYGRNVHHLSLYDPESGGCRDGLHATGVNENQGAESTIVHLLALIEMSEYRSATITQSLRYQAWGAEPHVGLAAGYKGYMLADQCGDQLGG